MRCWRIYWACPLLMDLWRIEHPYRSREEAENAMKVLEQEYPERGYWINEDRL